MKRNSPLRNLNKTFFLVLLSFVFLLVEQKAKAQGNVVTENIQSSHDGYFYSFWNDGESGPDGEMGSVSMTLLPGGSYSVAWNNVNNFTAGKGWHKGKADRNICYSANFDGGLNGYLAVYGWTIDPLIEYYIVESWGSWRPPGAISKGTFTSDGGTYDIYETTRTEQPSILGTATFQQYWSVRKTKKLSGTVTFANHVAAWESVGMPLGSEWNYQIMLTEGYQSTGSSNITMSECPTCSTSAPTTTSVEYCEGSASQQLTATGTALKWYTTAAGGTASTTAPTPSTSSAGTTFYYVSQTKNGCESPRERISVTVYARPEVTITPEGNTTLAQGETVELKANKGHVAYIWLNEDKVISMSSNLIVNSAGVYTLKITNSSGCTNSSSITVDITTGMHSSMKNSIGRVYPIPARDEVIIETEIDLNGALFSITNATGEEVSLPIRIEGTNAKMNVNGLANGTYLLMIRQNTTVLTKKIVVAN
jgi:hypothetical protein